ncbi:MAG: hypothetical protein Q4F34_00775 [Prevotellaceae bacterium]|nr:hypothetical protein [Prevotellaceae bacterium]
MKTAKWKWVFMLCALMSAFAGTVKAENIEFGDITYFFYVLDEDAKTAYWAGVDSLPEKIVIPEKVTFENGITYTVASVKAGPFYSHGTVQSVEVPATVTSYDTHAFQGLWIKTLTCYNPDPVYSSNYQIFSTNVEGYWDVTIDDINRYSNGNYENTVLYVPFGSGLYYSRSSPWKKFKNIKEGIGNRTLQQPVFSVNSGTYDNKFSLTITNPNGKGTIYYYVSGEGFYNPEVQEYNGSIDINKSCKVTAWISNGSNCCDALTMIYDVNSVSVLVQGIEVSDKNKDDVLGDKGSVSFNNATATLTLNGAYIDAAVNKANYGIETNGGDFNIKVLGTNYVNGGIIFNATGQNGDGLTMTIEGDAKAGNSKLYINQADYEGIYAYLSNVRIIDCELIIRNVGTGITMKASAKLGGNLDVENATVRINANESAMTGVYYLNLGKGISIIEPVGAVFAQGYGNILVDDKVQSSVLIGPEGTPTGISDIKTDGSKHTIYDLSGRALKQTKAAGIYVVDGRKVVIR